MGDLCMGLMELTHACRPALPVEMLLLLLLHVCSPYQTRSTRYAIIIWVGPNLGFKHVQVSGTAAVQKRVCRSL